MIIFVSVFIKNSRSYFTVDLNINKITTIPYRTEVSSVSKAIKGSTGVISTCQVNERFKRICDKYGIRSGDSVNQHMLRHTFATRSMESGMAYDVLQKMIGHRSIKTTIDTYCDVFEANEQKNVNIMKNKKPMKFQSISLVFCYCFIKRFC